MPQRAAYWPARRTLIVADLHLGKSQTLGVGGLPIPAGETGEQLERLGRAIDLSGAERLLVLGDLMHAPAGLIPELIEQVARWRALKPIPIVVVPGNHDRRLPELAAVWGLVVGPARMSEGPFDFVHEPEAAAGRYSLCGHIHPAVRLRRAGDSLKLACFHFGRDVGVLPAFSRFTGGAAVRGEAGDGLFAIADGAVVAV